MAKSILDWYKYALFTEQENNKYPDVNLIERLRDKIAILEAPETERPAKHMWYRLKWGND